MFVSRHVKFVESVFPYKSLHVTLQRPTTTTIDSWVSPALTVTVPFPCQSVTPAAVLSPELPPCPDSSTSLQADCPLLSSAPATAVPVRSSSIPAAPDSAEAAAVMAPDSVVPTAVVVDNSDTPGTAPPPFSASSQQPAHTTTSSLSPIKHSMTTRAKNNIHKPIQKLNLHTHLSSSVDFEPTTVQSGSLRVAHVSSKDQLADALTKPLPRSTFQILKSKIGLSSRGPS
ncbi:hypothetical protein LWI29_035948 [Acer saccharum]|uniref:Uncharacterized protein n=1 Tax=Acer saccharum TaxID=4024 RepID=A0AA39W3P8_ACESA|nr:hypothetical protein LWI29_035948 [Acer saccharum]